MKAAEYSYFLSLPPLPASRAGGAESHCYLSLLGAFPSYFFLFDEQGRLGCFSADRAPQVNCLLERLPCLEAMMSADKAECIVANFRLFALVCAHCCAVRSLESLLLLAQRGGERASGMALCFVAPVSSWRQLVGSAEYRSLVPIGEELCFCHFRSLLPQCSETEQGLLTRAKELAYFAETYCYCSTCGQKLHWQADEHAKSCADCAKTPSKAPSSGYAAGIVYPRQDPSVIALITWQDPAGSGREWLLLGHNHRFREHLYSLVAGFVEAGETLEQALLREAREEAGLHLGSMQYLCSQAWPSMHSLMAGFLAHSLMPPEESRPDGTELLSLLWLERCDLQRYLAWEREGKRCRTAPLFLLSECRSPYFCRPRQEPPGFCLPDRGTISRRLIETWAK